MTSNIVKLVTILPNELDLNSHTNRLASVLRKTLAKPFNDFIPVRVAVREQTDHITGGTNSINNHIANILGCIDGLHAAVIRAQEKGRTAVLIAKNIHNVLKAGFDTHPPAHTPPPSKCQYTQL
jgi:hypothetical protein